MPMFYFRFEVRPKNTHPQRKEFGRAMVNCWILRDTQDQAKAVAYGWIGDQDWRIIEVEAATLMTKESLEGNSRGLQYFQQAEIDNEVFVFHTWPRREPDDRSVG